jgi:hypothetical protein
MTGLAQNFGCFVYSSELFWSWMCGRAKMHCCLMKWWSSLCDENETLPIGVALIA